MTAFKGIFSALPTPFRNGDVDFSSLKRLVDHQLSQNVDGLVVSGTTAESPTLLTEEKRKIFEFVAGEVAGQVPVVVGTGSNCTQKSIEETRSAERWGAEAFLIVTPFYNRPPQEGLVRHFQNVAGSTDKPIILYNVPSRCGVSLTLESVKRLSEVENIIGIKEASGDIEFGKSIRDQCPGFTLLSGDDPSFLEFIDVGGDGAISVLSNVIPERMKSWQNMVKHESWTAAVNEFNQWRELIELMYIRPNPIGVKGFLKEMGLFRSHELRLPLVQLEDDLMVQIKSKLIESGVVE